MYLLLPLDQFTRYFQLHKAKYTNAAFVTFLKLLRFLQKRDWLLEKKTKNTHVGPLEVPCQPLWVGEWEKTGGSWRGRGGGEGQEREANHLRAELPQFPDLRGEQGLSAVATMSLKTWAPPCSLAAV